MPDRLAPGGQTPVADALEAVHGGSPAAAGDLGRIPAVRVKAVCRLEVDRRAAFVDEHPRLDRAAVVGECDVEGTGVNLGPAHLGYEQQRRGDQDAVVEVGDEGTFTAFLLRDAKR